MNGRWISTCLFALAFALLGSVAQAQIPQRINYQGYLSNAAGQPVNAPVPMVFRLYDVASGGTALWTETQPSVQVTSGVFNAALGAVTPITLGFDKPYWLGVTVGTDSEMTPRQPLASNPYALRAKQAEGLAATATVAGSQVTGTIAGTQVSGAITNATLSGGTLASLQGQFVPAIQPTTSGVAVSTVAALAANRNANRVFVAIAGDGLPVVAYAYGDGTNNRLYVIKCGNISCSQGNSTPAALVNNFVEDFAATIGADGFPVFAIPIVGATLVVKCGNAACSSGNTKNTALTQPLFRPAMAISSDGTPVIAGYSGGVRVLKCANATCSSGNVLATVEANPDGGNGDEGSIVIAVGTDGFPIVAWWGRNSAQGLQHIRTAKCANASCISLVGVNSLTGNAETTWYSPRTMPFISLAIGADGLPIFAAQAVDEGFLFAKCGLPSCYVDARQYSIVKRDRTGSFTAIAIGADGLPVASGYDENNNMLVVAKCFDTLCKGGSSLTNAAATTTAFPGFNSSFLPGGSIAIAPDGFPIIAFHGTDSVKVAKCNNLLCSPTFLRR